MDDRSQKRGVTDDRQAEKQRNPTDRGGAAMNKNRGVTDDTRAGEKPAPTAHENAARLKDRSVTDDPKAGEQRKPIDRDGTARHKKQGVTDDPKAGEQRNPTDRGGAAMNKKKVGGRLLQLRGMRSQEEVAAALGIRQSTLAMYERGSRMPRDEIKLALAHYYGCSVESLFFSENDTFRGISR